METGKERFARFRERVRATAALISVGATCHVYLQQAEDPDKLRAVILEIATDLIR